MMFSSRTHSLSNSYMSPQSPPNIRSVMPHTPSYTRVVQKPCLQIQTSPKSLQQRFYTQENQPQFHFSGNFQRINGLHEKNLHIQPQQKQKGKQENCEMAKIKQDQTKMEEHVKSLETKILSVNTKVEHVLTIINETQQKILTLQKFTRKQQEINSKRIIEMIKEQVSKKIYENQQHLHLQSKLIKAEMDTMKLQLMNPPKNRVDQRLQQHLEDCKIYFQTKLTETKQKFLQQFNLLTQQRKSQKDHKIKGKIHSLLKIQFKLNYMLNPEHQEQSSEQQVVYGIDEEGYLLDSEGYYLLDLKGGKIRLQQQQIQKLKKEQLFSK